MLKKLLVITFGVLLPLALIITVFIGYGWVFDNNVKLPEGEELVVLVYPEQNPRDIYQFLVDNEVLENEKSFIFVAQQKKWNTAKTGRYVVKKGMSNDDLVNMFRAGLQEPLNVTLNNISSIADLAGMASHQLMEDSTAIFEAFVNQEFLQENNVDFATVRSLVIPNTFEFYWNVTADDFRDRLVKAYHEFWNETRLAQAKKINLSPLQVAVLASIVQKETAQFDEMPVVAGLYLNRLKQGILLQSDPTVIYAKQLQEGMDLKISRVLYADLKIDSPYNTYKYAGLPPAPITIATSQAIDAVLQADNHKYIFMCANPDNPGYHSFAETLRQHNINKEKYVRWLNKNNIKR